MLMRLLAVFTGTFVLAFSTFALFGGILFLPLDTARFLEALLLVSAVSAFVASAVAAGAFRGKATIDEAFSFLREITEGVFNALDAFRLLLTAPFARLGFFFALVLVGAALLVSGSTFCILPLLFAVALWWGQRKRLAGIAEEIPQLSQRELGGLKGLMLAADGLCVLALFLMVNVLGSMARVLDVARLLVLVLLAILLHGGLKYLRNRDGGMAQFSLARGLMTSGYFLLAIMAANCVLDFRKPLGQWQIASDRCQLERKPSPFRNDTPLASRQILTEGCSKLLSLGRGQDPSETMLVSDMPGALGIPWRRFEPWR